jgi:hypothetical protein
MKTLALVSLVGMVGACSSSYMPRSRGRIAVMMQNGAPTYVRDGQPHPHGWFGAGLSEAVAGNRLAEQAADEYHDRLVDGVLLTTVGALCMPATLAYALVQSEEGSGLSRTSGEIAGAVAIGCAVMLVGGAAYAASAEPYRWDAINLFNDGAEPNLGPPTASAQLLPHSAAAKTSLEMR